MPTTPGLRLRLVPDKSEGERIPRALARPLATLDDGRVLIDPADSERILLNPATDAIEHEPWPLLGAQIEGDPLKKARVSMEIVQRGKREGWIELEGEELVHRPGGPPDALHRVTHTFVHATAIILKTLEGDLRYRVVRQPDKYADDAEFDRRGTQTKKSKLADDEPVTDELYAAGQTRVDWFYDLELEG